MNPTPNKHLHDIHTPEAISDRLQAATRHSYLGDFVLGAVDGTITTFAIVAGIAGVGHYPGLALVLGLANVLADGFSMAVSNFLKARAEHQLVERLRRIEEAHIDEIPEGEREEIRQIFAGKGFDGPILEEIVTVITMDRKQWVDTMLKEEWGLQLDPPVPLKAALATFVAFLAAGLIPLVPLMFSGTLLAPAQTLVGSAIAAAVTFFVIGAWRGRVVNHPVLFSGLETLAVGGAAASLAYFIGTWLRHLTEFGGG